MNTISFTCIFGGVTRVNKRMISADRCAYNIGIATENGYGERAKKEYVNGVLFANTAAQMNYFDELIVEGAQLPFVGRMVTGKPYEKDGATITPMIFQISDVNTDLNQVFLSGRITEDAVVSVDNANNYVIARYTIAVNKYKKNSTNYIRCVQFGKGGFANYAKQYLVKGKTVAVRGTESTGTYTKQTGERIYTHEIIVQECCLFGKRISRPQDGLSDPCSPQQTYNSCCGSADEEGDEELPF